MNHILHTYIGKDKIRKSSLVFKVVVVPRLVLDKNFGMS